MIHHSELGKTRFNRSKNLFLKVQSEEVTIGANRKLKIFGRLDCRAGKRMKAENRVFFKDSAEAIQSGYRPCAVCMKEEYRIWKLIDIQMSHFPT